MSAPHFQLIPAKARKKAAKFYAKFPALTRNKLIALFDALSNVHRDYWICSPRCNAEYAQQNHSWCHGSVLFHLLSLPRLERIRRIEKLCANMNIPESVVTPQK